MSWNPADVCLRLSSHCSSLCPLKDGNAQSSLESQLHQVPHTVDAVDTVLVIFIIHIVTFPFSHLLLLVGGWQEGHLVCKKAWYWCSGGVVVT